MELDSVNLKEVGNRLIQTEQKADIRILNSTLENSNSGIILDDSSLLMKNSTFSQLGSMGGRQDGICVKGVNPVSLSIENSTFSDNVGDQIGCLSLSCSVSKNCSYSIVDSTFSNNSASLKGGAIYYDSFRPNITNSTFLNNSAIYGPDVAGYPIKIVQEDGSSTITYEEVASG